MTTSATSTRELTIDQIVLKAYQLAGLLPIQGTLSTEHGSFARTFLDTIVDHLQAMGIVSRGNAFEEVEIVEGQAFYNLSGATLDVHGDAAFIGIDEDVAAANGETPIRLISAQAWQGLSSKAATGRPSIYYPHRTGGAIEVRLWPTPSHDGTVRFQVQRLLADNTNGNNTPDLERPWAQYLIWELAHQLAVAQAKPLEKCKYLAVQAENKLSACRGFSNSRGGTQIYIDHQTSWGRYR